MTDTAIADTTTATTVQCSYKTAKGRRCKLNADHAGYTVLDSTGSIIATRLTETQAEEWENRGEPGHVFRDDSEHRMVLRTGELAKPKSLAELKAADPETFKGFRLVAEVVPETVQREYRRDTGPRDADQVRVDKDAAKSYEAWKAAGSPVFRSLTDAPKGTFVLRYIFPPAAWNTVTAMIRRSTQRGGPVDGKRFTYARKTHVSGNAMLFFAITDPIPNGDAND